MTDAHIGIMEWSDPPRTGADPTLTKIVTGLKRRPGEWAKVGDFADHYSAAELKDKLRRAVPLAPIEAKTCWYSVDGSTAWAVKRYGVWARWASSP